MVGTAVRAHSFPSQAAEIQEFPFLTIHARNPITFEAEDLWWVPFRHRCKEIPRPRGLKISNPQRQRGLWAGWSHVLQVENVRKDIMAIWRIRFKSSSPVCDPSVGIDPRNLFRCCFCTQLYEVSRVQADLQAHERTSNRSCIWSNLNFVGWIQFITGSHATKLDCSCTFCPVNITFWY